jgi:hypothetical protein
MVASSEYASLLANPPPQSAVLLVISKSPPDGWARLALTAMNPMIRRGVAFIRLLSSGTTP